MARGGFGNIEAMNRNISTVSAFGPVKMYAESALPKDVEANRSAADDGKDMRPIAQALESERRESGVASVGRGGAGNMRDSKTISRTIESNDRTAEVGNENNPAGSKWQGRGGAGNYLSDSSQSSSLQEENITQLDPRIMADVEAGLQKPDKAYLGPKHPEA